MKRWMLCAALSLLIGGSGCGMVSKQILYPDRQPLPKGPADYGLVSENVELQSSDGVKLAGWLMKGTGRRLVVMAHPGNFTRYGFSAKDQRGPFSLYDKDVEFLRTAKRLVDAGYWVLSFDFRNHGESGRSPNDGITGLGLEEYRDVLAALQYTSSRPELAGLSKAVLGFCMGANSTIVAASRDPAQFERAQVKAVVLVQPVSFGVFLRRYASSVWMPQWVLKGGEKRAIEAGGRPIDEMSPLADAAHMTLPVLHVQARKDPWTELAHVRAIYDAFPAGKKEMLWLDEPKHRFDTYNWFADHPEPLLDFLDRHLASATTAPAPANEGT
jgi:pimeloyl-ACP methyl ester carboxylesterase